VPPGVANLHSRDTIVNKARPDTLGLTFMRLTSKLGYAEGFLNAAERAVKLEEVGVDVVWVAEAYGYDAVARLGYLAARTKRMQLGSGILNIYSRTPALLAQTAAGLDDVGFLIAGIFD
jgi:alkanesulfonate monooxygenase SsuD/methylene tetrahydromethanopterin reductase-like flavin-dependent oxidoreductase (luciferase family)